MKVLAIRSVPLSDETQDAWKAWPDGLKFLKRTDDIADRAHRYEKLYDVVLNLGHLGIDENDFETPVYNTRQVVSMLNSPGAIRRSPLCVLLPPEPTTVNGLWHNVWVKKKGFHDEGKEFHETLEPTFFGDDTVDVQQHIEGDEWRILSVGDKVVQASRKEVVDGERVYTWVGVKNMPRVLQVATKYAASLLPSERTVIGWDWVVVGDDVFLFEGNTSPGVNEASARRILDAVVRNEGDRRIRERFAAIRNGRFWREPVMPEATWVDAHNAAAQNFEDLRTEVIATYLDQHTARTETIVEPDGNEVEITFTN